MAIEFINLDEQEQNTPIIPDYPHSISNIKPDTKIIDGVIEDVEVEGICAIYDIVTITIPSSIDSGVEEDDQICIKDDCDVSKYYGCATGDGGFQKDNLFSELTDEYQRTQARINLGIADEYTMVWGNIKGNLSNQKDLYTFVTDSIVFDISKVVDEINLKLAQWACEIEIRFKDKADIFSPNFIGAPTTTVPVITNNSNRIASTEWVNAKIAAASINENIRAVSLEPEYMCYGDEPADVKFTWDYVKDVDSQLLNGIVLHPDTREYTFSKVTTSQIITLKYTYEKDTYSKVVVFDVKYPTYYGVSPDITKMTKTIDNVFKVTANTDESIYIMIPNGSNALLAVSSIVGGFKLLGRQEVYGNIYYTFKSANTGLGETVVELMSQVNNTSDQLDTTTIRELLSTKANKYEVYNKDEINQLLDEVVTGEGGLHNYYTKIEVDTKIPDVSQKADRSEIPLKVSDLPNDAGYITGIPQEYVTEAELQQKGYISKELEPLFIASAAKTINLTDILNWNNKVDKITGKGLSSQDFLLEEKIKLKGLANYDDTNILKRIVTTESELDVKANRSELPDISHKADKTELPTLVSQLENDKGYLTILPGGLITEEILTSKGYLTSFTESDPTVPLWAKQPTKPTYTAVEVGAEVIGSSAATLISSTAYTNTEITKLISGATYNTLKKLQTAIETNSTTLATKANKTELFSGKYGDLSGTPIIPSIVGLATEVYVNNAIGKIPGVDLSGYALLSDLPIVPDISGKVDKIVGKQLSTNDYTTLDKEKLESLVNYNDAVIKITVSQLEEIVQQQAVQITALQELIDSLHINSSIILE